MGQLTAETNIKDGMNVCERAVKRCLDVMGACVGLVLLSPVFLLIYLLLKKQGYGSAIFSQERIGYKGLPFRIYKFRTMCEESEVDGLPRLAEKDDVRLTPVGKYLRVYHLDELPQLWNVLKGDMSFVGPRPERRYFIDLIMEETSDYDYIYLMRPGLTSKATLHNGYTDTMEKMLIRLRMDLDYLRRRSLWLDTKIIFTTTIYLLTGKKF